MSKWLEVAFKPFRFLGALVFFVACIVLFFLVIDFISSTFRALLHF